MSKKREPTVVEEDIDSALDAIIDGGTKVSIPVLKKRVKASESPSEELTATKHFEIDVDKISIPEELLRAVPEDKLEDMTNSIKRDGLLQPILINKSGMLIAGYRRLLAHKRLKMSTIKVNILDVNTDEEFRLAGVENLQRKDLSREEWGNFYKRMLADEKRFPTYESVASAMGYTETHVGWALNYIGETKKYSGVKAKKERKAKVAERVKKCRDDKKSKIYRLPDELLPADMKVVLQKNEIAVAFTLVVKDEAAKNFDLWKEIASFSKDLPGKEFCKQFNAFRDSI